MDTSKPGPLLMLGGGALMVIATLLDWRGESAGLSFDSMGLFGIVVLLSGLMIAAVGGIRAFGANVSLPDDIAGFSLDQICLVDAFTAFIWTFALISGDFVEIGVHLTWLGAAIAATGAALNLRTPATDTAPGGGS